MFAVQLTGFCRVMTAGIWWEWQWWSPSGWSFFSSWVTEQIEKAQLWSSLGAVCWCGTGTADLDKRCDTFLFWSFRTGKNHNSQLLRGELGR